MLIPIKYVDLENTVLQTSFSFKKWISFELPQSKIVDKMQMTWHGQIEEL